jgi:hypothetical protein
LPVAIGLVSYECGANAALDCACTWSPRIAFAAALSAILGGLLSGHGDV